VLESDRRECIENKTPARPKLAKIEKPFVNGPGAARSVPVLAVDLVEMRMATSATPRPVLFQPPFASCMMGQMGLLVQNANFAILEAITPIEKADMRASRRRGWDRSAKKVAAHARQDMDRPKPTANKRGMGRSARKAIRPESESRWKNQT
jgi:hypothetical protein